MAAASAPKPKSNPESSKGKGGKKWGSVASLKSTDVVTVFLDVPTAKTLLHALSVALGGGSGGNKGKGKGKGGKGGKGGK